MSGSSQVMSRLLPGLAGSTSKAYGACACSGESTAQYFIWGLPQGNLIPVPWKGWRDEQVLPTAPHGSTCVVVLCRGALLLDRWRPTGHPWKSQTPCFGAVVWVTWCLILTPCWGAKLWMWAPPPRGSTEPPLCCKNKRVQNLLYKGRWRRDRGVFP